MAEKQPNLALGMGTPAYDEYTAAQQNLKNMLAERENRLFDPTLLAMAQGFFAPTKTGGFGESLGNVAGALAPVQAAEEKRAMDLAKMRLEVAQQGVQTGIQVNKAQQNADAMKKIFGGQPPPAAQAPAQAPAPMAPTQPAPAQPAPQLGGLPAVQAPAAPQAAPQAAPLSQPAPVSAAQPAPVAPLSQPVAQQAPRQPQGSQLFPAMPENLTEQEKMIAASMFSNNKEPYEILKEIDEMRRKQMVVNERGVTNLRTGEVFSPVDPTPTEVRLPDGTTHITTKTMATRLAGAQAAGNAEEYFKIVDQIQKGMTRPTPVGAPAASAAPAPATAAAPVGRPRTKEEEDASAAQTKAEATKRGEGREGRTNLVLDAVKAAEDTRIIAQSAKDVINQPNSELFMGIFEKPKIKTALAKMVEDTVFAPTNFREAVTSLNIALSVPRNPNESGKEYTARKQDIMDRYIEATTLMAQAKFAASLLSKGQGTITDGERKLFADTTINTKMSVNAFNKISDMLIERSKFAEDLGGRLAQNKMQIDDFKQTPEYKKMAREYEGRLTSILRSGRPASKPSGGRPDLNAAGANVDKQTD
jgi:hypothetical protein